MKNVCLLAGMLLLLSKIGWAQQSPAEIGDSKMASGDYAGAIANYSQAFRRQPLPGYALKLGIAYYQLHEYNKAIIYLSKATVKNVEPSVASDAYLYRGISRIAQENYADGYADLRKSLAVNPKNAEVYRQRGMAEAKSGDYIKAIQDFSTFAMYAPKTWQSYDDLANEILKSGTRQQELLEKAYDLTQMSMEIEKNEANQKTLTAVNNSLKNSSGPGRKSSSLETMAQTSSPVTTNETKVVVAEIPKQDPDKSKVVQQSQVPAKQTQAVNPLDVIDLDKIRKRAKVWAVVIGVSKYTTNNTMNLAYAASDAEIFYNFLRSPAGGSIPAEQITLLTNEKATRTEILKAMRTTFTKAFDTDVIILYIASHGQTENGEFYFLTTEAETGFLDATALSRASVADAFNNKQIRAKKKMIFADACHSGEMMKVDIGSRDAGDEANKLEKSNQLLVEMAQTSEGCAIMTASTGAQKSYEDAKWGGGHGVFTYSLIQALKGKADYDENKIVTINEVNEYVFRTVTEATQRKQQPSFQGSFDNDFPMSVVLE